MIQDFLLLIAAEEEGIYGVYNEGNHNEYWTIPNKTNIRQMKDRLTSRDDGQIWQRWVNAMLKESNENRVEDVDDFLKGLQAFRSRACSQR